MSTLYFDIWAPGSINGAALGELTSATNRQFRKAHLTVGSGQLTINRHDAQAAWVVPRSLVRVRFVTGGPFAYNDARYKFAFWIEESSDVALSEEEDGGDDLTRGGRSEVAILQRAILYPTAADARDTAHANKVSETGNWKFKNRTPGEVLSIFLRNAEARTPNPLAPLSRDFGIVQDSTNTNWPDVNTDWQIPVGTNGLDLLGQLTSAGVYWRCGPDLILHAYEVEPGVNLSATITLSKGVDLESAAEKQIHASPAISRAIVHGVRENNTMKYREVINSTVETAIGRIEGFVEYKRTPTNSRLDRAGNRAIRKAKNQYDGPTTVQVLDATGRTALVDYQPGDTVTINIPGVFDSAAVQIAAIAYEENEVGEADPVLELIASPFDPASGDGLTETGGGGGKGGCGDCPEPVPFIPGNNPGLDCFATYPNTPAGTYGPNGSATTPTGGINYYCKPGIACPSVPTAGFTGAWNFPAYGNPDYAGDCAQNKVRIVVVGPGVIGVATAVYGGAHTMTAKLYHDSGGYVQDSTVDFALGGSITVTVPDDGFCVHFLDVYDSAGSCGSKWGFVGSTWSPTLGTAFVPEDGQRTTEQIAGHAAYTNYITNYPYAPGSLVVKIDGIGVTPIEMVPTAGTFQLGFDATGKTLVVTYQIMSSTPTGATNPVPTPTVSPVFGVSDHGILTGLADNDHPQYLLSSYGGGDVINTVAASGSARTLSLADGNVHNVTLTANCTFTFSGADVGRARSFRLYLWQDATGGRTVTWPASVVWSGGVAPTLVTTAGTLSVFMFETLDGGVIWNGYPIGSGAPTTADYLVGTAQAGLSGEIVVGTTPGGELGGTWAVPTVDATHSGSAHHAQDHATRHGPAAGDPLKLDDLAAPDDNTDLNATTGLHGLLPKLGGGTANFLRADGTWNAPAGGYTDPLTTRGDLIRRGAATTDRYAIGTAGQALVSDGTDPAWTDQYASFLFTLDGAGSVISTGIKGDLSIPFACTITRARLLADQSGSIVVDVWVDTYANYPPTVADTITASAKPTLSSATKSSDVTLTGWTTALAEGSTIRLNVDSATTVTRVSLELRVRRT